MVYLGLTPMAGTDAEIFEIFGEEDYMQKTIAAKDLDILQFAAVLQPDPDGVHPKGLQFLGPLAADGLPGLGQHPSPPGWMN